MYLASKMIYLYCESPLHAGAGAGLGAIDLPIQRERYTGNPLVQSSGLKGAFRSQTPEGAAGSQERLKFTAVFGPDDAGFAGAFSVGDARVLLFPVRSLVGVFAWVTCLDVLQRWQREAQNIGGGLPPTITLPTNQPAIQACYAGSDVQRHSQVILEEYALAVDATFDPTTLAGQIGASYLPTVPGGANQGDIYRHWKNRLNNSLVIVHNDVFRDFVMHTTEVLTRVRLTRNTKTAADKGLWTEEHLPSDTLLYAPVRATPLRTPSTEEPTDWQNLTPQQEASQVLDWVKQKLPSLIQLGGDETVGRGMVRLTWQA